MKINEGIRYLVFIVLVVTTFIVCRDKKTKKASNKKASTKKAKPDVNHNHILIRSIYKNSSDKFQESQLLLNTTGGGNLKIAERKEVSIKLDDNKIYIGDESILIENNLKEWKKTKELFSDVDDENRYKIVSQNYSEARRRWKLPVDRPIINNNGYLKAIDWEDIWWKYTYAASDIFFILKQNGENWEAQIKRNENELKIEINDVHSIEFTQGFVETWNLNVIIGSEEVEMKFTEKNRVYSKNPNISPIEWSGYYPTAIVPLFGPVESGKSQWVDAVLYQGEEIDKSVRTTVQNLMGGKFQYACEHASIDSIGRTETKSLKPFTIKVLENEGIIGIMYLIDLSGELTEPDSLGDDAIARIRNIISNADILALFSDNRCLKKDKNVKGDLNNIIPFIREDERKQLELIYICSKADIIKKECSSIVDWLGNQLLTEDSILFHPAKEEYTQNNYNTQKIIYTHSLIASDVLKSCNIINNDKGVGFFVSAGTDIEPGKLDHDNQMNVELTVIYLIQRAFGIRI